MRRFIPLLLIVLAGCSQSVPVVISVESDAVVAFRAAIDAGKSVEIPEGSHDIYFPLVVKTGVSLTGKNAQTTVLRWKGDKADCIIHVDKGCANYTLGGFSIIGPGKQAKSPQNGTWQPGLQGQSPDLVPSVGIRFSARTKPATYAGTVCMSGQITDVVVSNFDVGFWLGDAWSSATSENQFQRCSFYNCDTAVYLTDYNTLNNSFRYFNVTSCRVGILSQWGGGETRVQGGSASSITGSVFSFTSGGVYAVRDYRQGEGGGGRFLKAVQPTITTVESCTIDGTGPADKIVIEVWYDSILFVRGCILDGTIQTGYFSGSVVAEGNMVRPVRARVIDNRYPRAGKTYTITERGNRNYATGAMTAMDDYTQRGN